MLTTPNQSPKEDLCPEEIYDRLKLRLTAHSQGMLMDLLKAKHLNERERNDKLFKLSKSLGWPEV